MFPRTAKKFRHIHRPASTTTNRQFHPAACPHRCHKDNQVSRKFQKFKSVRRAQMEMVSRLRMSTVLLLIFLFVHSEDHYSNTPSNRPYSLQQPQSRAPLAATNGSNGNGNGTEEVWLRQGDGRSSGKLRPVFPFCFVFFWLLFCDREWILKF